MRFSPALLLIATVLLTSCPDRTSEPPSTPPPAPSESIHPSFRIAEGELPRVVPGLPAAARLHPGDFLNLAAGMLSEEAWILQLVDKQHPLPEDFSPPDIVRLADFPEISTSRDNLRLSRIAAESLAGLTAAAAADGIVLTVASAYRSREYQAKLFARYADRDGEEAAARYSARPGESQHQLGTTVDFGDITNRFASTDSGGWITENGNRYGWSLSYPEGAEEETGYMWESWHWRYIGRPAAEMQERYFDGSQQALLEFWSANHTILKERLTAD